jgi:hypothetical protein
MTTSYKDVIYFYVSVNGKPMAEYYEKEGNFREFTINLAKDMKKGRYVVNYPK